MSLSLASTLAAALGRLNSAWGLGDSHVTSIVVFPGVFLFLPLLLSPSLFFCLHHHHSFKQDQATRAASKVSSPMKNDPSCGRCPASEREEARPPPPQPRRVLRSLSPWIVAVGAVLLAFLIALLLRSASSSSSFTGGVEFQQESGKVLFDATQQKEVEAEPLHTVAGEGDFFFPSKGLVSRWLSWGRLAFSGMPSGTAALVSSLYSLFNKSRPASTFPYSPERPLRVEMRLFVRRRVRGQPAKEGEKPQHGKWTVVDALAGEDGRRYAEDIGVLIR